MTVMKNQEHQKSSGIYKITNITNNKCYVGSTKNFAKRWKQHIKELKNNSHHSIKLQRSFNKHGINNFSFEIVEEIPYEKNLIIEQENFWIKELNSKENGYNITDATFGDVLTNNPNREKIIKNISKGLKEKYNNMTSDERKKIYGREGEKNGMFGKIHSEDVCKKMSENHKNKCFINKNEELLHINKNELEKYLNLGYNKGTGIKLSEENKKLISDNAKLRIGEKNPFYGKTHSEETRKKISVKNMGKKPPNTKPLIIDNIKYLSANDASKILGIKSGTITHRCKSKNILYKNYYFIDEEKNIEDLYIRSDNSKSREISVYGKIYKSKRLAFEQTGYKQLEYKAKSNSLVYKDIFYTDKPKNINDLKYPTKSVNFYIKYNNEIYFKGIGLNKSEDDICKLIKNNLANIAEFDNEL
jgi:group I intron endonuclease